MIKFKQTEKLNFLWDYCEPWVKTKKKEYMLLNLKRLENTSTSKLTFENSG